MFVGTAKVIRCCFGVGIGGRCSEDAVIAVEMPKDLEAGYFSIGI